ncbi:MAG: type VI secretion system Vgr family protein [Planctomycetota bacterium]
MPTDTEFVRFVSEIVGQDELLVATLRGTERICRPFRYELDLVSRTPDIDLSALVMAEAGLGIAQRVDVGGSGALQMATIRGVLSEVEQGERDRGWHHYHAVLVPALWRLSLRRNTRLYLDMSTPEIITELLEAHNLGAGAENRLRGTYTPRAFVLQYREDDLAFLTRICEAAGISFFFIHDQDDQTKVVFIDDNGDFPLVDGEAVVPFQADASSRGGMADDHAWFEPERLSAWTCRRRPVLATKQLNAYDPLQPTADLSVDLPSESPTGHAIDYVSDCTYVSRSTGEAAARIAIERARVDEERFCGKSDARNLRSGHTFSVTDHDWNNNYNGDFIVTGLEVEAVVSRSDDGFARGTEYRNRFDAIRLTTPYRPPLCTPKPVMAGGLTAHVTAAPGSEQYAHLDEHGRYKVRFAADLLNPADDTASCWLRRCTPYAGTDNGMHFPLLHGTEVVVLFIDGDPDRPYIADALPNVDTPSVVTQANKTQNVIKTVAQNELRFDDEQGKELIYLHSAKDLNESVDANRSLSVGNDQSTSVGNDQSLSVGNDRTVDVSANQTTSVGGNDETKVGGNAETKVGGNREDSVGGNHTCTVGGKQAIDTGSDRTLNVGANAETSVSGNAELRTGGDRKVAAGTNYAVKAAANAEVVAGATVTVEGGMSVAVNGPEVAIAGATQVRIACGGSSVTVTPTGVEISGPMVDVSASAITSISGAMIKLNG